MADFDSQLPKTTCTKMSTPVTVRANPVQARPETLALLERLHAASLEEESSLDFTKAKDDGQFHDQMRDKFVALDQDKCWFVYQMILAKGARSVLEVSSDFSRVSGCWRWLNPLRSVPASA